MQEIIPFTKLGDFSFNDSLNKVLSLIKQKGEMYQQCDIVIGDNFIDPLYLVIPKEGIKLRFNSYTQKLELIEKVFSGQYDFEYYYNKKLVFSKKNKEHIYYSQPNYSYINSIFGMSKMPKVINNNKHILLPYNGISFLFENSSLDDSNISNGVVDSEAKLYKMIIYSENNIIDSIRKDNLKVKNPSPLVRYNMEKGEQGISLTFYKEGKENTYSICIGESLEEILNKMKNPNFVYFTQNNSTVSTEYNFNIINNTKDNFNDDCILNYFSYGIDVLIQGKHNVCKRLILHTNSPQDKKFGIYERCNFKIELNKQYFKKIVENSNNNGFTSVTVSNTRKSVDAYKNDTLGLSISLLIPQLKVDNNELFSLIYPKEGDNNNIVPKLKGNSKKKQKQNNKNSSEQLEDKLNESLNDSDLSIPFDDDSFNNIIIYPWSNFNNIIYSFPKGTYSLYQRHDNVINRVYKYYIFEGIVFEVMDNGSISSVVIYSKI